jgi:phage terminase large subunit GpA-like protein
MAVPGPLREIYRSTAPRLVVMKGAQLGVSEWAINFLLHTADTKRAGRGNGLYIMPTADEVARFQQARVQPAIQASSYLRKKVGHNRAQKGAENMELLRLADAHIYWRGANSTTALRAMDCDSVVIDEADGVSLEALALAEHRLDSSEAPLLRILGHVCSSSRSGGLLRMA